jgi:hypothetical protein
MRIGWAGHLEGAADVIAQRPVHGSPTLDWEGHRAQRKHRTSSCRAGCAVDGCVDAYVPVLGLPELASLRSEVMRQGR